MAIASHPSRSKPNTQQVHESHTRSSATVRGPPLARAYPQPVHLPENPPSHPTHSPKSCSVIPTATTPISHTTLSCSGSRLYFVPVPERPPAHLPTPTQQNCTQHSPHHPSRLQPYPCFYLEYAEKISPARNPLRLRHLPLFRARPTTL